MQWDDISSFKVQSDDYILIFYGPIGRHPSVKVQLQLTMTSTYASCVHLSSYVRSVSVTTHFFTYHVTYHYYMYCTSLVHQAIIYLGSTRVLGPYRCSKITCISRTYEGCNHNSRCQPSQRHSVVRSSSGAQY